MATSNQAAAFITKQYGGQSSEISTVPISGRSQSQGWRISSCLCELIWGSSWGCLWTLVDSIVNPEGALPALKHRILPFQKNPAVVTNRKSSIRLHRVWLPLVGLQPRALRSSQGIDVVCVNYGSSWARSGTPPLIGNGKWECSCWFARGAKRKDWARGPQTTAVCSL